MFITETFYNIHVYFVEVNVDWILILIAKADFKLHLLGHPSTKLELRYKVHIYRVTYYQDVYHSTFSTKGIPLLVVLQLFQMIGRQGKYFGFLNMAAKIYLPLPKLL